MQAPWLPHVLVGHAHPAVALGRGDHRLEQPAVCLLDVGTAAHFRAGVVHTGGKRITNPLELAKAQHARPARSADAPVEALAPEVLSEQPTELGLEPGDLASQVDPRGTDVSSGRELALRCSARVLLEQVGQDEKSLTPESLGGQP